MFILKWSLFLVNKEKLKLFRILLVMESVHFHLLMFILITLTIKCVLKSFSLKFSSLFETVSFFSGGDFEHRIWTIIVPWFLVGVTSILSTHEWMGLHILIFFHKSGKIFEKDRPSAIPLFFVRFWVRITRSMIRHSINCPLCLSFPKIENSEGIKTFSHLHFFLLIPSRRFWFGIENRK